MDWPDRKHPSWRNRGGATWLTKRYDELAWAGVLSGEQKCIDGAKNIVLTIIREGVSDGIGGTNSGQVHEGWLSQPLDAGHSSLSLAILCDLLHDHLAEGERAEVRDCMGGAYIAYLYEYMVKAREAPRYLGLLGHNFAPIGDSAGALMALAMLGETGNPEQEQAWLEVFMEGIRIYLDIGIGVDGGALEGAGYTSACLHHLNFPLEALHREGRSTHAVSSARMQAPLARVNLA